MAQFTKTIRDQMTVMKKILIHAMLLLLLLQSSTYAQKVRFDSQAVDSAVRGELRRQGIVGAAIGVIRGGEVAYVQGYGFRNFEDRLSVDKTTVFNWASNSKPLMAVAALQLVESGHLDLDVTIGKYGPIPASLQKITVRHLLCHQSGIPHYSNGKIVSSGEKVSLMEQLNPDASIKCFINSPLLFEPGSKTEYSSYAYVLLSSIVQAAGKADIDTQLTKRIVEPLRLTSFQLDVPYDQQPNWTFAYRTNSEQTPERLSDTSHFWKHGAGGYKSNVEDFAKWAAALMTTKLLRPDSKQQMWTPQRTTDRKETSSGLGFAVSGSDRSLKVSHGGSQDETKTRMVLYPNQGHGMVVMCNTADADPSAITTAVYKAIGPN
jgi:serine beta-lactamase-like protein LACTB, mitochondrial